MMAFEWWKRSITTAAADLGVVGMVAMSAYAADNLYRQQPQPTAGRPPIPRSKGQSAR
ncbi:hypothetical protein [Micromonospora sp. HM134]|uniref:hypothetical protein n=2 Tax=unclassified Micromonospora TaxID=2617518 RepID=UPI00143CF1E7|nr:hypothetical protein [Micromonospora sp. HM134]